VEAPNRSLEGPGMNSEQTVRASSSGDQTDKRVGGLLYWCSGITICDLHGQREAEQGLVENEGVSRLHGTAKLKLRPAMWWSICTPYPPGVLPQGLRRVACFHAGRTNRCGGAGHHFNRRIPHEPSTRQPRPFGAVTGIPSSCSPLQQLYWTAS
jgi:hypothetical protein